jgi:hypothetical protein
MACYRGSSCSPGLQALWARWPFCCPPPRAPPRPVTYTNPRDATLGWSQSARDGAGNGQFLGVLEVTGASLRVSAALPAARFSGRAGSGVGGGASEAVGAAEMSWSRLSERRRESPRSSMR